MVVVAMGVELDEVDYSHSQTSSLIFNYIANEEVFGKLLGVL